MCLSRFQREQQCRKRARLGEMEKRVEFGRSRKVWREDFRRAVNRRKGRANRLKMPSPSMAQAAWAHMMEIEILGNVT